MKTWRGTKLSEVVGLRACSAYNYQNVVSLYLVNLVGLQQIAGLRHDQKNLGYGTDLQLLTPEIRTFGSVIRLARFHGGLERNGLCRPATVECFWRVSGLAPCPTTA